MHIKSVRIGRTVSHNYNSAKGEVEVELEKGDSFDDALKEARRALAFALKDEVEQMRASDRSRG